MRQLIILTILLLFLSPGFSQTKEQDSLTIQLVYQKQDSVKVDTSIKLIRSYYNTDDLKKALLHIDQSEKLATSLDYHKGIAEIKYYKGLIYTKKNDYFNALDNYNKSLAIFGQLRDSTGIAKVNNSIGIIEIKRGNFTKGLRYSLSAIDIFERSNMDFELGMAYNNLAEVYFNTRQYDKALDFNLKALQVRERLGDRAGIVISTRNIAELYSINKEHRKAIEYFEKTLQSIDDESGSEMRGEILPKIGDEYLRFNDITNATTYLLRGLNHNRRINNKNGILKSLNSLANLNLKLKKTRLAESQLDRAFALTREVDNEEELLENYRLRITMDSLNRNFRKAFNWQNRYYDLKEKIDKKNAVPILIEEPEDLELPPQNVIIPEIISENGGAAKRQLKLIIYGLIVLIIIVTALLVGFLMNRRTKEAQLTNLRTKVKAFDSTHKSLLDKNKELEETNQAKDRLFSIVSHDLKDSITSIKAFLDLLKDDGVSKEEFDNLIPELSENANNASALLINLLNWSKSQMENLDPNPEEFNIQDVFSEKLHLIEKKVKEKRIVVLNESHKDMVYADKGMIGIVIQNLLANAVKFSKVGDVITVSNRDRNNNVLLCVEDTGVGISAEDQLKLFKASGFTTRGTAEEKGTGLGLSICKELVELNHGRIWVESEPNMGSKFFVELPRSKPGS